MALVPKKPWEAKTERSAVMPAPDEGSYPAIVRRFLEGFRGASPR